MQDILLDSNYDLAVQNGDFATGESADQDVEQIVLSQKGEWKQYPVVGFGIENYLKKTTGSKKVDNIQKFVRDLKVQLSADGKGEATIILNDDLTVFKVQLNV